MSSSRTFPESSPRWEDVQGSLLSEPWSPTWPKQGMWDLGAAYELATSVPPISASESSSLLPTPSANDSTGAESETRKTRREQGKTGGPALRDLPKLLPTPTYTDARASRRETVRKPESQSHPGTTLTDAIRMLPTPTVNDARNTGGPSQRRRRSLALTEIARDTSGGRTHPPSPAGSRFADAERQHQLTIEDA
jgi:hypothetical protein